MSLTGIYAASGGGAVGEWMHARTHTQAHTHSKREKPFLSPILHQGGTDSALRETAASSYLHHTHSFTDTQHTAPHPSSYSHTDLGAVDEITPS